MPDPHGALRDIFGFDDFRPGQEAAVRGALDGRDVLVVMPTGAGKSLCYQLPALLRPELSVVVSPLVSLMQDQVEALERRAPGAVALVNAQRDAGENREVLERARRGDLRLLYVAPERFASPGFLEALRDVPIGLFAVDEAHCVSQWGHDFRPDYFRLADAARWLGAKAIIASTATATPQVAADVERRLGLHDPVRVATGFDRPNLTFAVAPSRSIADSRAKLHAALSPADARPAIVYAGTRAQSEQVAADLAADLGIEVLVYHAGLSRDRRAEVQRRFMSGSPRSSSRRTPSGWASTRRTCARSLTCRSRPRSRAGTRRPAAPGATAVPRARFCWPRHATRASTSSSSSAPRWRVPRSTVSRPRSSAEPSRAASISRFATSAMSRTRSARSSGTWSGPGCCGRHRRPMDRLRGRLEEAYDGRARAVCRSSAADATRARWRQYRSIWAFVESDACRRAAVLHHFGDAAAPAPEVVCCDACDAAAIADVAAVEAQRPAAKGRERGAGRSSRSGTRASRRGRASAGGGARRERAAISGDARGRLDEAILDVVGSAQPAVGRTRAVQILRGGRSKIVEQNGYDELPVYGTFAALHADDVLGRVDELLEAGRLVSTGGRFPKLALGGEAA